MTDSQEFAPLPSQNQSTFGVVTGQHQYSWPGLVEHWRIAEEAGFDSLWLFDHFLALYGDPEGPTLETSTLLAALATLTSRARIGVLVYGNTHRNPAILAKEMVTVDHISGGRAMFGIGTGWNEPEHRMYSIPFPSAGDRVSMLDEALTAIESFFTNPRTTFRGEFYQFEEAPFSPKPVQERMPILIGGKRPRMLQVVARHADIWDASGSPDEVAQAGAIIDQHCEAFGRPAGSVLRGVSLGADVLENIASFETNVRAYHAAGVRQFLFDFPISQRGIETALTIARDIIPSLRAELDTVS
jgi:alkanesulfonate monooxygenase SsuD/methylene tetrahydromethanopterin reductase-like flavin-dependent oxidoreductase (luciferase family)